MGCTAELLDDARAQLAPSYEALEQARHRREVVLGPAKTSNGVRDSFNSGSLANHRLAAG